jgi:DNA-binding NarL/FixJ family response regulator
MERVKVIVVDDHEIVREGIRVLLQDTPFEVIGEAGTGREAIEAARTLLPDIVIMDIAMPDLNGLEATRQIRRDHPNTEVLIVSVYDTETVVKDVLRVGARAYVAKADTARDLVAALEALSQQRPYFSSSIAEFLLNGYLASGEARRPAAGNTSPLTIREREILQLVAEGRSNKEVANHLNISVKTAEAHRAHVMSKLHLRSVADLVHYAVRNGIIAV